MHRDDDDDTLLAAWQNGDARAGDRLFQRHFKSIRRFFLNKVAPGEEEELIQATFLGCVKGADRFRGESSFRTYLFQVAHNVLADHYRKKHKQPQLLDLDEISVADLQPGHSSIIARNRQQSLLLQALRQISITSQIVLKLYYWEDMSAAEIGQVLRLGEPAVRSRIRRAHEALKQCLARLARTPQELSSTVDNLDRWAREIRAQLDGDTQDEEGGDDDEE